MTRLSNSAVNKYLECGKAYDYHYNKRLRSKEQSAALLFGTAIDKATEKYALNIKANLITREEAALESEAIFVNTWARQEINGKSTDLWNCTEIVYGNNDLDLELLSESDHDTIIKAYDLKDFNSTIEAILQRKDQVGFRKLSHNDKLVLNHANWICMFEKGKLMLKAFLNWFDENVQEVLAAQKKTELEAGSDSAVGFIDLIAYVRGQSKPVILDVKTAGRAYEPDAVVTSVQLSTYVFSIKHEYEDTNTAGYIVLHKNIKKNKTKTCVTCGYDGTGGSHKTCPNEVDGFDAKGKPKMVRCNGDWKITINPEAVVQYMVDEVPELLQERVVENYEPVLKGIQAGIYPRNFSSCKKYGGAVICPYLDLCLNNCSDNLIKKDD